MILNLTQKKCIYIISDIFYNKKYMYLLSDLNTLFVYYDEKCAYLTE